MNGVPIQEVSSLKLLGVEFTNTATVTNYILAKAATGGKLVGMLRRYSDFLSEKARHHIYLASIRPIMEYASPVFVNAPKYALGALDKIQRRAQRLFPSMRLDSLELRRNVAGLCQLFNIMNCKAPSAVLARINPRVQPYHRATRLEETSNALHLFIAKSNTKLHQNSFLQHYSRIWNGLSTATVVCASMQSFKMAACNELRRAE